MTTTATIPGYTYGSAAVAKSPLSDSEFEQLKQSVLLGEEDLRYLRLAGEVLEDQIEAVLDVWYGFIGSHAFLVHYFTDKDGKPLENYLAGVRKRFGQWIRDTCAANYDRAWLDYQYEIALRHTPAKKNQTDGVQSATDHVPLRYMVAFIYPVTATIRPFLAKKGHSAEEVDKMHNAWFKSVTLQIALWSQPYAREGLY